MIERLELLSALRTLDLEVEALGAADNLFGAADNLFGAADNLLTGLAERSRFNAFVRVAGLVAFWGLLLRYCFLSTATGVVDLDLFAREEPV